MNRKGIEINKFRKKKKNKQIKILNNYLFYPAQLWPHKDHITVLKAFNKIKTKCNLDLIFKWATLHLDLKQANVLKPLQGMLLALFNMLKEDSYVMTEYEVSVILPCLALHVGNKIERLADNYRTMMRIISTLHDPAKVAQLILFGIDARAIRNSKSRKINLDEIGRLIVTQGWKVVGTKGLRSIASEIDSQTEAIRQGALVAIVAAWEKIDRDTEKIFKCIGRSLSSKGETLLKQRLEAVSGEPIPDFTKNQVVLFVLHRRFRLGGSSSPQA